MTFYYDSDDEELIGNNALDDVYGFADADGDTLVMDVATIMEDGRGVEKLQEMRDAVSAAIEHQAEQHDMGDGDWVACVRQAIQYCVDGNTAFALRYVEEAESEMTHGEHSGAKDYVKRAKSALTGDETDRQAKMYLNRALRVVGDGA